MLQIGNKVSRDLWEAKKPKWRPSSRDERERFIKAKYEDKEFLAELPVSNSTIAEVGEREREREREREGERGGEREGGMDG
jgi:hypothetical protein